MKLSNKTIFACILLVSSHQGMIFGSAAIVTSTGDAPALNPAFSPLDAGGQVTLRSAIQYINAQAQASNTINFNISGTGPFRIQPNPALDPISQSALLMAIANRVHRQIPIRL